MNKLYNIIKYRLDRSTGKVSRYFIHLNTGVIISGSYSQLLESWERINEK